MKIFAVTLVLLVVKGIQGRVIPQDESKSNQSMHWQQPYWDVFNIGSDIARAAFGVLAQSEKVRSAMANLSGVNKVLNDVIGNSMNELATLSNQLKWNGIPITTHILNKTEFWNEKLNTAGQQIQEAVGNETSVAIHMKLMQIQKEINQYTQNLSLIAERFNQTYESATQQLEEWNKRASPYTDAVRTKITEQVQELRNYLTPVIHESKEAFKKLEDLVMKSNEAPVDTDAL